MDLRGLGWLVFLGGLWGLGCLERFGLLAKMRGLFRRLGWVQLVFCNCLLEWFMGTACM